MSNSSDQGLNTSLVAVALLATMAAGGLYFYEPKLESSRPDEPGAVEISSTARLEDVEARLWEDPFTAVEAHVEHIRERHEKANDEPWSPGTGSLKALVDQIASTIDYGNNVMVMPVMVRGGSYAEDNEQRRRRRYAVLSALGVAEYQPRSPERIGYFFPRTGAEGPPQRLPGSTPPFVPYEWLSPDRAGFWQAADDDVEGPRVLVLWLSDDLLGSKPLASLAALLSDLNCAVIAEGAQCPIKRMTFPVKVIGPWDSEGLRMMVRETLVSGDELRRRLKLASPSGPVQMYSPSATINAEILWAATTEEPTQKLEDSDHEHADNSLAEIENAFENAHISFFRTNIGDGQLAQAMLDEFKRRHIFVHDPRHIVVLLAEWDTLYGRALPETFEYFLLRERTLYQEQSEEDDTVVITCPFGVCRYSYLRGLDGENQEPETQNSKSDASNKTTRPAPPDPASLERPVGESQYDYLRRLAQVIKSDVRLGDGEVKAVGILGSDVYDKLLALQALRDRFPGALFFTTDMDSHYLHASQQPWTRNLIVASGFSLDPNVDVSGIHVPPFRDSYQTATFQAVRHALPKPSNNGGAGSHQSQDEWRTWLDRSLQPRLFEIGRDKAYTLNSKNPSSVTDNPFEDIGSRLLDQAPKLFAWFRRPVEDIADFAAYEQEKLSGDNVSDDQGSRLEWYTSVSNWLAHHVDRVTGVKSDAGFHRAQYLLLTAALWLPLLLTCVFLDIDQSILGWYVSYHGAPQSLQVDLAGRLLAAFLLIVCVFLLPALLIRIFRSLEELREPIRLVGKFVLAVAVPAALLASVIAFQQGEEPVSMLGGVSIWPAEAIRLVAIILSALLLIRARHVLRRNADVLYGRYVLKPASEAPANRAKLDSLLKKCLLPFWRQAKSEQDKVDVRRLWGSYVGRPATRVSDPTSSKGGGKADTGQTPPEPFANPTFWRVVPLAAVYTAVLVVLQLSSDYVPSRGNVAYVVDRVNLVLATGALALLLMYVVHATLMCQRFIVHLSRRLSQYPSQTLWKFARVRGMSGSLNATDLVDWLDVQLIANRTRAVTGLVYSPFLVLLLLWASYSQIFDQWRRSITLIAIFLVHAALILVCQITLRRAAEKGRRRALDRLDHRLSEAIGARDDARAKQLGLLIKEVQETQEGAFRPFSQQPILKALLVPFVGGGSMVILLEQLVAG